MAVSIAVKIGVEVRPSQAICADVPEANRRRQVAVRSLKEEPVRLKQCIPVDEPRVSASDFLIRDGTIRMCTLQAAGLCRVLVSTSL